MRKEVTTVFPTKRYGVVVSVPQKIVKECIHKNDVLHIVYEGDDPKYQGQVMTMDPDGLKNKVLYSAKYKSKFGNDEYMLDTLKWNPNIDYDD